jgi:hypothetical protein
VLLERDELFRRTPSVCGQFGRRVGVMLQLHRLFGHRTLAFCPQGLQFRAGRGGGPFGGRQPLRGVRGPLMPIRLALGVPRVCVLQLPAHGLHRRGVRRGLRRQHRPQLLDRGLGDQHALIRLRPDETVGRVEGRGQRVGPLTETLERGVGLVAGRRGGPQTGGVLRRRPGGGGGGVAALPFSQRLGAVRFRHGSLL